MEIKCTPQELAELVAMFGGQINQYVVPAPTAPRHATYTETIGDVSFTMVAIRGGSFDMGSPADESWRWDDEGPQHRVSVPDFHMGQTVVTQELWQAVMGNNPSYFTGSGPQAPVDQVSWNDAQEFLRKLNQLTGKTYKLPTEAQWEYAAGGGANNRTIWAGTNDVNDLDDYAWYNNNSDSETHPVKEKRPNTLGLYDMSGNVWEWCEDDGQGNYEDTPTDGSAWVDSQRSSERVVRGGSWGSFASYTRAACRGSYSPDSRLINIGFRLALSL